MATSLLPRLRTMRSPRVDVGTALAVTNGIEPTSAPRWDEAVLAFNGAGVALFGLLMLSSLPSVLGYFSVFAGFTAIAAVVPDLAVVLVILLLRLASQSQWPAGAEAAGTGVAVIALLAYTLGPFKPAGAHRAAQLQLGQCGIAFLAVCLGTADGRFAALVLLVLLILTRSAARVSGGMAATLAMAGLGGLSPLGVFPALVLVVMAIGSNGPWLLFPLGAVLIPLFRASLPRHPIALRLRPPVPSVTWVPMVLALLAGYCAPDGLVHWWHILTAGRG